MEEGNGVGVNAGADGVTAVAEEEVMGVGTGITFTWGMVCAEAGVCNGMGDV